jgi:hypothetical protein
VAWRDRLRFPNPVNEVSARLIAAGVLVQAVAFLVTGWSVLLATLAGGFLLRVLFGPRLSPLAVLVTRIVVPRLGVAPKLVPGPPKRFAQGLGAVLSTGASVAWVAGAPGLSQVLLALIAIAATLESAFALCVGCRIFAASMRIGIVPESVCADCADVRARLHDREVVTAG